METQTTIFEYISPTYKIKKPIRLIELFAGIGSQAKALKNLGADFEHWRVIEFDQHAVDSYNAIHGTNFSTTDIRNTHAADLGMKDRNYTYIMTYSFPCQDLSLAGNQRGMQKGSGTRSGLLWEVERIQQRERVIHPSGNAPTLTATEYKDPIKVFIPEKTKRGGVTCNGRRRSIYQPSSSEKRNSAERNDANTQNNVC